MFESLGFETLTPRGASIILAAVLGLGFGLLAERTKFCFRRGLVGEDRRGAMGVWLTALAVALLGTQGAVAAGLIDFGAHRFLASEMPVLAILAGGALFGAGMILTRGCVARLTVLSGTGNLRALTVLLVFAVTAHATVKGVLAPLRTTLGSVTLPLGEMTSFAALPGGALLWTLLLAGAALFVGLRSGNRARTLAMAAGIGLIVPLAWVGTGYLLLDEFDPIPLEGLSFTSPMFETLFWTVASTAIPAGFGTGLVGGTLAGALIAALLFGSFSWQSFSSPRETGRYMAGAVLMGVGGVLAGGCTIGAGLAGVPTLGFAALLALLAIAGGGLATQALLSASTRESGGSSTTPPLQPAE